MLLDLIIEEYNEGKKIIRDIVENIIKTNLVLGGTLNWRVDDIETNYKQMEYANMHGISGKSKNYQRDVLSSVEHNIIEICHILRQMGSVEYEHSVGVKINTLKNKLNKIQNDYGLHIRMYISKMR